MLAVQIFADIAYAALALLIAVLAIYLAVRLLGKLAKFVIFVVVVVLALWFFFSDNSFLPSLLGAAENVTKSMETVFDLIIF